MDTSADRVLRVLVVEDHARMRAAIVAALDSAPGLTVVADTPSVREALALATALVPDVAVLDIRLPDGSGLELRHRLREACPRLRCVIISSHEDAETRRLVGDLDDAEFVLKTTHVEDLIAAVLRAQDGLECAAG